MVVAEKKDCSTDTELTFCWLEPQKAQGDKDIKVTSEMLAQVFICGV